MKYRVMIVDDEPPFIRMLKRAITRIDENYVICDEAYNGYEALGKIAHSQPNIIFTDVKMPVMDGISFVKEVKKLYPEISIIIVSAYKEFEYAKQALKLGVVDYLLKPIDIESLEELLFKVNTTICNRQKLIEKQLMNNIIQGTVSDTFIYNQYFNDEDEYYGILIKEGCYYGIEFFSMNFENNLYLIIEKKLATLLEFKNKKFWIYDGSDKGEIIIIIKSEDRKFYFLEKITSDLFLYLENEVKGYITCIYNPIPAIPEKLHKNIENMKKVLLQNIVIGKSQLIDIKQNKERLKQSTIINSDIENKLAILIQNQKINIVKQEIFVIFEEGERQNYPIIWIDKIIEQIIGIIEKSTKPRSLQESFNIKQQIDEVLALSINYGEMFRGIWDIIEMMIDQDSDDKINKKNMLELLEDIEQYIKINISKPITIQSICNIYGISQPYLSRLFRRYKSCSFNEYVTELRIHLAIDYMKNNNDMLIKDVAYIVGYQDQHYFSRIFKKITGSSPTNYQINQ